MVQPIPKKKKKPTYAKLKKRLWDVFSIWTRLRFADQYGMVQCVSCGVRRRWNDGIDAGHFVSRSRLGTFVHPENVAPQCKGCNKWSGGGAAYAAWGVNRYGMDWPARMVALSKTPTKYSRSDLQDMITDYEQRIARLTGDERE